MRLRFCSLLLAATSILLGVTPQAYPQKEPVSPWVGLSSQERAQIEQFAEEYKDFLSLARTELSFVREAARLCQESGFKELKDDSSLTPGAKYYDVNRDRTISLIVVGERPGREGFRIVGAHIDSPRLELKPRALYQKEGFALFQTNYHGGIKPYQWTNLPLALMGRVDRVDGSTVWITLGNEPNEPIFLIPDLAPHVDGALRNRSYTEVIELEEMDPLVGHIPAEGAESIRQNILQYLKNEYQIEEDDFVSAELSLVPALPPRDVGFDRGLMAIYGQDDRLSAYAALRAIMNLRPPEHTAIAFLVDNEEVGSSNNTGARSSYLNDLMAQLLFLQDPGSYTEMNLRHSQRLTRVISSDVNPGVHPLWPSAFERTNAPRLGHGVNLKLYGRGFNANSEYIAWIRRLLDEAEIPWQTVTYKIGRGGGGTIGTFISDDNMEVIDIGVPVLSIHTPYSVSSKLDVYLLSRAMEAFYSEK